MNESDRLQAVDIPLGTATCFGEEDSGVKQRTFVNASFCLS